MELKLSVYDGKEIVKTYTSDRIMLRTGVCEDILKLVDVEKLSGNLDDDKAVFEIVKIVVKAFESFSPMMKDIFDGLTDDEYRNTNVVDVAKVVVGVIRYTMQELFQASSKN